jgi:hypothetical protein
MTNNKEHMEGNGLKHWLKDTGKDIAKAVGRHLAKKGIDYAKTQLGMRPGAGRWLPHSQQAKFKAQITASCWLLAGCWLAAGGWLLLLEGDFHDRRDFKVRCLQINR